MRILQVLFFLWISSFLMAVELKIEIENKKVFFTIVDGKEKFKYQHSNAFIKDKFHLTPKDNFVAYAVSYNVVVVDVVKKQIVTRVVLPEAPTSIKWIDGSSLQVKTGSGKKEGNFKIFVSGRNLHLPMGGSLLAYQLDKSDIAKVLRPLGFEIVEAKAKAKNKKKIVPKEIKKRLDTWGQFDICNPWVEFYQGLFELRFGSPQKSQQIWKGLLESPKVHWYHLFPMGKWLHKENKSALGRLYHKQAMRLFYKAGAKPRMVLTLITLMVHKGGFSDQIEQYRKEKKWKEASLLLEEYYEFSPRCEAFHTAMTQFATELDQAGQKDLAKTWYERAKPAKNFDLFAGGTGINAATFSLFFTLETAFVIAFLIFLLTMVLTSPYLSFVWQNKSIKHRLLSRVALGQMLVATIVAAIVFVIVSAGIRAVNLAASMPLGGMEKMNHPWTLNWIDGAAPSPAKHFYRALVFQARKDYKQARQEYAKATQFAQTFNNLALIDKAEGKKMEENLQKALAIDPHLAEAHWNLHKKATTPWAKVHQKYAPEQPMLAVPSGEVHKQFIYQLGLWPLDEMMGSMLGIRNLVGGYTSFFIFALVMLILLISLFLPGPSEEEAKLPRTWWLSFLVPGSSRLWSVLGFAITWIWVASVALVVIQKPGLGYFLSVLDAMASPNLTRVYGVVGGISDQAFRLQVVTMATWLMYLLPIVNIILVAIERKSES